MNNMLHLPFFGSEESSGFLLWQVTMAWQRAMKKELDKLAITHTQFVLLATISWLDESLEVVTQVDIAEYSHTDRMMVSKVLRTLEEKKMIVRENHKTDTRAKTIKLAPLGDEVLKQALIVVKEVDDAFFGLLGPYRAVIDLNLQTLLKEVNK